MATSVRIEELKQKFDENPRRYFAPLANELRKLGDLTQAIDICRSQLASQPGHVSGHIVLAQALFDLADLDGARSAFESALGLDPENLIALRYMGDIARERGDRDDARTWYQRVLDADPRNSEIAAIMAGLEDEPNDEGHASTEGDRADSSPDTAIAADAGAVAVSHGESWHNAESENASTPANPPMDVSAAAEPLADANSEPLAVSSDSLAEEAVWPGTVDTPPPADEQDVSSTSWLSSHQTGAADAADRADDSAFGPPAESHDAHAGLDTSWDGPASDTSEPDSDAAPHDWFDGPFDTDADDDTLAFPLDEEESVSAGPAEDDIEALFGTAAHGVAESAMEGLTPSDAAASAPLELPDYGDQPDHADHPDQGVHLEHADQPDQDVHLEHADQPDQDVHLERADQPDQGVHLERADQVDDDVHGLPQSDAWETPIAYTSAPPPDRPALAPFATETLAELYLEQGFREEALEIYRELLSRNPSDDTLRGLIEGLQTGAGAEALVATPASHRVAGGEMAAQSVRTFFGLLARRIPHQRHRTADPRRAPHDGPDMLAAESAAPPSDTLASASTENQPHAATDLSLPGLPSGSPGLTELFGAPPPPQEDSAAASLAAAFSNGMPSVGRPSRVSQRELSLDHLFHEEPAAAPTLDAFYDAQPGETPTTDGTESVADERAKDIQQFNTWLDGLKKK